MINIELIIAYIEVIYKTVLLIKILTSIIKYIIKVIKKQNKKQKIIFSS